MNTMRKLRRTLRKRKSLLKQLWRDLSALVVPPPGPSPRQAPPPLMPDPRFAAPPLGPAPRVAAPPPAPAPAPPVPVAPSPATTTRRKTTRRKRLQALTPPEAPPAPAPPATELPPGKRILMIDDDATFLELAARLLRGFQVVVETAVGPDDGLEAARQRRPDVIVLDFNMPQANGFEVIERLRREEELAHIPRVMMTGTGRAAELKEMLRWDVAAFIAKPVSKSDLVGALETALCGRLPAGGAILEGSASRPEFRGETPRGQESAPAPTPPAAPVAPPEEMADAVELKVVDVRSRAEGNADAEALEAPAVKSVASIIRQAIVRKASDVHIEPGAKGLAVRLRVDGELIPVMNLPLEMAPAVAARIKVMAELDIAERRVPQDGRVTIEIGARRVDFRVSTLPSLFGEKIVMRLIGTTRVDGDLTKLGLPPAGLATVQWALSQPNGLILLTGPTGSGKTTTLYRMLANLNNGRRNIVTVEDPIEGELEGITQVAVNPDIGLTFDKALRAFLRQDPDVMLVGEIRDNETADIAVRAAMVGRLILSTLHTNDAVSSVTRLVQMKVPAYMIAGSVRLVIAQRLIRLLCPRCRREDSPGPGEREALAAWPTPIERICRPVGCADCSKQGYMGRAAVLELFSLRSLEIREAVREEAPAETIRGLAVREGMVPLGTAALELVADGRTSLAEALRVAAFD